MNMQQLKSMKLQGTIVFLFTLSFTGACTYYFWDASDNPKDEFAGWMLYACFAVMGVCSYGFVMWNSMTDKYKPFAAPDTKANLKTYSPTAKLPHKTTAPAKQTNLKVVTNNHPTAKVSAKNNKSKGEELIPFDEDLEPGKVGTTEGF